MYSCLWKELYLIARGKKDIPVDGMKYQLFEEIFRMDCKKRFSPTTGKARYLKMKIKHVHRDLLPTRLKEGIQNDKVYKDILILPPPVKKHVLACVKIYTFSLIPEVLLMCLWRKYVFLPVERGVLLVKKRCTLACGERCTSCGMYLIALESKIYSYMEVYVCGEKYFFCE